jgi:hypothetical protein
LKEKIMKRNLALMSIFLLICVSCVNESGDKRIFLENGSIVVTLDPSTLETKMGHKDKQDELLSVSGPVFDRKDFSVDEDGRSILYPDDGLEVTLGLKDGVLEIAIHSEKPQTFQWPSIPMVRENTALIWPEHEGHYIPLDDDPLAHYLISREWNTLEGLYMPFWGVETEDSLITYIAENPFHNEITFHRDNATMRLDFEHSFTDNNDLSMPVSFRIHLDHNHTPITSAKHFRNYLIKRNSFVSLKRKMEIAPRISRLIGAPHAYTWDGAAITMPDIRDDGWIPLARTLVEQSRSPNPTPGKRIKHIVQGEKEGEGNWKIFEEMSDQQRPYPYLRRGVAQGLSKALLSPHLFSEEIWPEETLPDDLQKITRKEKPSRYELMRLNAHLLYSSFPDYLNDPATWGNGVSTRMIDAISRSGIDKFLLCVDGWEKIDIRPHIASYAEEKGYLIGTYDSYHSIHDPARFDPSWLTPQFDQKLYEEGGIIKRNGEPYGGFMQIGYLLSPVAARPYVERRVTENFANVPYSYYFVDCDAFGEFFDDYRPGRKVSQSEGVNARVDRIRWIFETFQVPVGSEGASYLFAGVLSVAEGVILSGFWGDPDMTNQSSRYFVGRAYPGDEPEQFFLRVPLKEKYVHLHADPRYLLPLYQAVFHDSVITCAHYASPSLKFTNIAQTIALAEILYQVPPMYHLNLSSFEKDKGEIKRHSQAFGRTHKYSYQYALEDFEFLTNERDVQRTRFGDLELIANFAKDDFDYHGNKIPGRSVMATFKDTAESFIYKPPDTSDDSTDRRSIAELNQALSSSEWQEREKAAIAIAKIGPEAKAAIPVLMERLDDEDWQVRKAAADALANLEPEAKKAVPALTAMLRDEEWQVRKSAAYALIAIGKGLKPAIPNLIEAVNDEEWQVRKPAVMALGMIGSDARKAVPALRERLNDPEYQVQSATIEALRDIGE